jgi:hypothetical protein
MKKRGVSILVTFLILLPGLVLSQPARPEPRTRPEALQILQLEMFPDPVREGQRTRFGLTLFNRTSISGRANIFIKDRDQDEVVAEVHGVFLQPGNNRVDFPDSGYRFTRREPCFTVEVDIAGTRRPVDFARDFCAHRTYEGWTLSQAVIGPFLVEDLEMYPDPAKPKQEVHFTVRLKNSGIPVRAKIRILDRDETVTSIDNIRIEPGINEYQFPDTRYFLQRFDHCFIVVIEAEGKSYKAETRRDLCARPLGWTLRP